MTVKIEYSIKDPFVGRGKVCSNQAKSSQIRPKLSNINEGYVPKQENLNIESQKQKIEIP